MATIPTGTPVIITFRGKTILGKLHSEYNTLKGLFYRIEEDLTGKLRSARPAQVTAATEPAVTTEVPPTV